MVYENMNSFLSQKGAKHNLISSYGNTLYGFHFSHNKIFCKMKKELKQFKQTSCLQLMTENLHFEIFARFRG